MECDDESALFAAVDAGDVESLRQLLNDESLDFDLERVNEEYRTVLHLAVLKGDLDMTNLLLPRGADVQARSSDDDTCLHLAVTRSGHEDLVRLLLRSIDADSGNRLGRTPLHVATIGNKYNAAKLLLNEGADPNTRDLTSASPLHDAIRYIRRRGGRSLVELLLRRGADPNASDSAGNTPFHASFDVVDLQLLELFLDKRANVDLRDEAGRNALHLAASRGVEIVERLLELGMNVDDSESKERKRPLHLAILGGDSEDSTLGVVRLLVERGAEFDAVDADDKTPLYHAAASDRPRVAQYLLSLGAEVDGRSGKRPRRSAATCG